MKRNKKESAAPIRRIARVLFIVGCTCSSIAISSCTYTSQEANPTEPKGFIATTGSLSVDRTDCRVICAQAIGESRGFSLFGFIPIKQPSETQAVKDMYNSVAKRGVRIEGLSAFFANRAVERSTNYYILWSSPTIRASGDLVEYIPGAGLGTGVPTTTTTTTTKTPVTPGTN